MFSLGFYFLGLYLESLSISNLNFEMVFTVLSSYNQIKAVVESGTLEDLWSKPSPSSSGFHPPQGFSYGIGHY